MGRSSEDEVLDPREPSPNGHEGSFRSGGGRPVTPARIMALPVIGLVAALLVALAAAGGEDRLSVPPGAQAGQLTVKSCTYTTEDGDYAADCGTLVVPEDRANPQSRLIAIPVTRIRARTASAAAPLFRLEGGPGITNLDFDQAGRFAETRDVVLVGYRGVEGTVKLDCPEVTAAVRNGGDALSARSLSSRADAFRSCAKRLGDEGVDVTQYGVVQQVDDLEAARQAFGYDRIDLVSESAGTRTALIYAWRYPDSVHRSVLVGVNPPGHFMWDPQTTDEQLDRYTALCAEDPSCHQRTDDLAATIRRENADLPGRWVLFPIKKGNLRTVSFLGLMESTTEAPIANAPQILDSWLAADHGDASGLWFGSLAGDLLLPRMFVWGQYAAFGSIDQQAARDYFAGGPQGRDINLAYAASATIWAGGQLADAWPAAAEVEKYQEVSTSQVETLLIGGPLDFSTPPENATKELLPHLPNGHQVVLEGFGHSFTFWTEQPEAGTRLITTFLDRGQVDDSPYQPQRIDFTPSPTGRGIAKLVVAVLVLLAFLAIASLLGVWLRVQRRGHLGQVASGLLRSLSPIVVGLGGWSAAVLGILIVSRSAPIDDTLLTVLAIGVSVSLAVSLAWVDRDRSLAARKIGFAAALAGGLIGTWLGLKAIDAPLVNVITGITGASAGANLVLLGLDIVGDQRRDRRDARVR